jgi:2-polyprenyl-6-methoxyphenol hydroxylase-like FAD-dependent oxidoreductase
MDPERVASESAIVAGGGIAGLASAVALAQAGWRVTVLERAPASVRSARAWP